MKTIEELANTYLEYHRSKGKKLGHQSFLPLTTFTSYCVNKRKTLYISQKLVDEWCIKRQGETELSHNTRAGCIRQFLRYTNSFGYTSLILPTLIQISRPKKVISETELPLAKTFISEMMDKYIFYLKASNHLSRFTHKTLIRFNKYCASIGPDENSLNNNIVNGWCSKRPEEQCKSRNLRVSPVCKFLKYTNKHGWTNVLIPDSLPNERSTYTPHGFNQNELNVFFHSTATIKLVGWQNELKYKLRKIQVPVYFRLLYSTGMRTNEARMLRCKDVDLTNGIINIAHSKGLDQHRVALHPTMWNLLKQYNKAMERLMPNRKIFFPNKDDYYHGVAWHSNNFRNIWRTISYEPARAYDLRSLYAVSNINSWEYDGTEWFDKLLFLSHSMGHRKIESTCYYYQLVPLFFKQLEELTGQALYDMLPDLTNFFDYEKTD
ncbi:tyrosine-type recombinase/integrase [Carboxylicivirga sp. RSCT41]|uniref:tyrosine-type recombinase/integrase n=1 Tax=Carboxylicivirga agarovorans TaxID=3417570 RepID=UPI003D34AB01